MENVVEVATMLGSLPLAFLLAWLCLRALFCCMPAGAGYHPSGTPRRAAGRELLRVPLSEIHR